MAFYEIALAIQWPRRLSGLVCVFMVQYATVRSADLYSQTHTQWNTLLKDLPDYGRSARNYYLTNVSLDTRVTFQFHTISSRINNSDLQHGRLNFH